MLDIISCQLQLIRVALKFEVVRADLAATNVVQNRTIPRMQRCDFNGRGRMYGSLGWGLAMFIIGIALDNSTYIPGLILFVLFFKHYVFCRPTRLVASSPLCLGLDGYCSREVNCPIHTLTRYTFHGGMT